MGEIDDKVESVKDVLRPYLDDKEQKIIDNMIENITSILEKGGKINEKIAEAEKRIDATKAKIIADVLFLDRKSLIGNQIAMQLFKVCSIYHDKYHHDDLIFGEGALEPEGVLHPRTDADTGHLPYQSPF